MSGAGEGGSVINSQPGDPGLISDLYRRETHIYSTRSSDGYYAVDCRTEEPVTLWTLRFSLAANSPDAERFMRRLSTIEKLQLSTPEFRRYGVDASGAAFLATRHIATSSLFEVELEPEQIERIFLQIVSTLAVVHSGEVFLGDICGDTFAIDRAGAVVIQGLLGSFDVGARQTAMLPRPDTLPYLAPEQQSGGGPSCASDVYALGLVGYRLFTGRSLHGKRSAATVEDPAAVAPAPSVLKSTVPFWLDDVLGTCLQRQTTKRYGDAQQIFDVIREAMKSGESPGGSSAWSRKTLVMNQTTLPQAKAGKEVIPLGSNAPEQRKEKRGDAAAGKPRVRRLALLLGVAAGLLLAFGAIHLFDPGPIDLEPSKTALPQASRDESFNFHIDLLPAEMKPHAHAVLDPSKEFSEVQLALAALAESKEPAVNAFLLELLKRSAELRIRSAVQHILVERVRHDQYRRSADVLEKWFSDVNKLQTQPEYGRAFGLLLRACEKARSDSLRYEALLDAHKLAPAASLQVAASLALDESQEKYVRALREMIFSAVGSESVRQLEFGGLLFADRALHLFIDQNPAAAMEWFSDFDLRWALMRHLDQEGETFLFEIAEEVIRRKLLSPFRAIFLEALLKTRFETTPSGLRKSLVRGAVSDLTEADIQGWARWQSKSADEVLLAAVATARQGALSLQSFDVLAGRRPTLEPINSLIEWVKARVWQQRAAIIRPIATLSLQAIAPSEDIKNAFEQLAPFAEKGLLRAIIQSDDAQLISGSVARLGSAAKSNELLPLLAHEDVKVRASAVIALEGRNELAVLQAILQNFERERDPGVRKLYTELHWVTRDRDKRPN